MSDSDDEIEKLQFKIVVLGDGAVGKTSIIHRFAEDDFQQSYIQTIGVNWFSRTLSLPENIEATLNIWDIGGQQVGSKLLPNYLNGAHAVIFCYDITNYQSFKNLKEWYECVHSTITADSPTKPIYSIMGNKIDLKHLRSVKFEQHEKWAKQKCKLGFAVSAKTGENVNKAFYKVAARLSQVNLPKDELDLKQKVITAQIVNHPKYNDDFKVDEENENETIKKITSGSKKNDPCVIN